MLIRPFAPADEEQVVELWRACNLLSAANDPHRDIARKLAEQPELFLVGKLSRAVVATVMVGYEGHRGWINYLAVAPQLSRFGLGRQIMDAAERLLRERDCPKINLMIRGTNRQVIEFYERLGYAEEYPVVMSKRLD